MTTLKRIGERRTAGATLRLVLVVETRSHLEPSSSLQFSVLLEIDRVGIVVAGVLLRRVRPAVRDQDVALVVDLGGNAHAPPGRDPGEEGDPELDLIVTGEPDLGAIQDILAPDPGSAEDLGVLGPGLVDIED